MDLKGSDWQRMVVAYFRRYLVIKKNSQNVPTQIDDFERRLCAQTKQL